MDEEVGERQAGSSRQGQALLASSSSLLVTWQTKLLALAATMKEASRGPESTMKNSPRSSFRCSEHLLYAVT